MAVPGVDASAADRAEPLVVSSYTLGEEVSFEERVRVAAEAGFAGIGFRAENYVAARAAGLTDRDMKAILDSHGVRMLEVEYVTGWGTDADRDAAQREKEETVFHLAREFGAARMNTTVFEKRPLPDLIEGFAGLCRRAGDLPVALEFLPYTGVPDLPTAWRILERTDRPNAGMVVDAWHWARSGAVPADLEPVPAERIWTIQLCDVREHPMSPLRYESLHHRLAPGQGYGDVVGMLRAMWAKGVRAMLSVEVMSDDLLAGGLAHTAETVIAASREVLAASRATGPLPAGSPVTGSPATRDASSTAT